MNRTRRSMRAWGAPLALGVAVVAIAAYLALGSHPTAAPTPLLTGTTAAREVYWHTRLAKVGPSKAYAEFAQAVAPLTQNEAHENAHAFGGALFEVVGLSGISTCDARFNYGCYHEFLGRAIASLGLGVVEQLNDACMQNLKTSPLSCQHGIGHGIQAAEGYDEAALEKSLAICKDLKGNDTIGGCYGGVFMEYNTQTMLGDQAKVRPIKPGDPYYPCDILAAPYLPACAFWTPQWWSTTGLYDPAKIGPLCDGLKDATLVRDCYQGLGVIAPSHTDYDPAATAAMCDKASRDPLHAMYCKSYAANSLNVGGGGEAKGIAVCNGLEGTYRSYCVAYATNKANQAADLPAVK